MRYPHIWVFGKRATSQCNRFSSQGEGGVQFVKLSVQCHCGDDSGTLNVDYMCSLKCLANLLNM